MWANRSANRYQYSYGVSSSGEAGDLVFFDEHGYGISHVGIATGYGTVIHSSTYYGAVVETPIEYIPGYMGAVDPYQGIVQEGRSNCERSSGVNPVR